MDEAGVEVVVVVEEVVAAGGAGDGVAASSGGRGCWFGAAGCLLSLRAY